MPLSSVDQFKAQQWFSDHGISEGCPQCGSPDWDGDISGTIVDLGPPPKFFPIPTVTCLRCASCRTFSATAMGLVPSI